MSKINKILAEWLPGDIHTLKWFAANGVNQRVAYGYSETGAIHKIGPGVFSLPNIQLAWPGAIRAIQEELSLPIHLGGRSALELQGVSHNVMQSKRLNLTLIASEKCAIPSWIRKNDWNANLTIKRSSLISGKQNLTSLSISGIAVKLSTREQAILELIDSLDLSNDFETAENYLSSLLTMRPSSIQELMERCSSVKVKRVFLYLAEKMELPFFPKLTLEKINLGSGNRVIVKGGQFNSKYKITVPKMDGEVSIGF